MHRSSYSLVASLIASLSELLPRKPLTPFQTPRNEMKRKQQLFSFHHLQDEQFRNATEAPKCQNTHIALKQVPDSKKKNSRFPLGDAS
ncbi:hypothetical protein BDZ45DRAFT_672980 [Acephala macrosclerotiorum]|nr:hypothetical protein BDZ45DRAFT_672980 [Acephala macrosclerotiorum]